MALQEAWARMLMLPPCSRRPPHLRSPADRGQMADVLGLTIETVSRQLTRFKTSGIITLPGTRGVTISDRAALEAIAAAA